jgi:hypothetical protein
VVEGHDCLQENEQAFLLLKRMAVGFGLRSCIS